MTLFVCPYQITAKGDEFFSMLVFKDISSKHSGKYTCYASNSAATVNHTSELLVKGKVVAKCIVEEMVHFLFKIESYIL